MNSSGGAKLTSYSVTDSAQPWTTSPVVARGTNAHILQMDREKPYGLVNKLAVEFIGTAIFVFIGSMSGVNSTAENGLVHAAFAHGLTIFVLVASLGHISGGHYNPAVTWAVVASGKLSPLLLIPYWVVQFVGGFFGSLLVRASTQENQFITLNAGATTLSSSNEWYQGLIIETVLTLILTQTILNSAVDTSSNVLAPLAIGMTVMFDIFSAGSITGASMNPVRSLSPAAAAAIFIKDYDPSKIWTYHYIYWAGPLVGATISAFNYRMLFSRSSRLIG